MDRASGIRVYCRHDAIAKTSKVRPNPDNPNTHPPEQIERLVGVITANGWRVPITISSRSGMITKGHGRLLAAQHAGWDEVPIERQHYKDESSEWADVIADNQLSELGETDASLVGQALAKLRSTEGFQLAATGYVETEVETLLARLRGDTTESFATRTTNPRPPTSAIEGRKTLVLHFTVDEHREFETLTARAMQAMQLLSTSDTILRLVEEDADAS